MESDVTILLGRLVQGDRSAYDALLPMVYRELKATARGFMRRERDDHTLQATALIHEACLRLFEYRDVQWQGRARFLQVAARAVRRVLVDHARKRKAAFPVESSHCIPTNAPEPHPRNRGSGP